MTQGIERHDRRTRRCPMLGHVIEFAYCRAPGSETPCRKIFDCWWEEFDVVDFVRLNYGEEGMRRILEPPKQKVQSLADLIAQARRKPDRG